MTDYFADWNSPEDAVYDIDFGEPNPVVVPQGFADYFKEKP
jgi:hypothetical protein